VVEEYVLLSHLREVKEDDEEYVFLTHLSEVKEEEEEYVFPYDLGEVKEEEDLWRGITTTLINRWGIG
jgi:hypothetical protein